MNDRETHRYDRGGQGLFFGLKNQADFAAGGEAIHKAFQLPLGRPFKRRSRE